MTARRLRLHLILATVLLAAANQAIGQGPVSAYYLTAGDQSQMHRLIGTSVTSWTDGASIEYPVAVLGTVRTAGRNSSEFGFEYSLAGTATGGGPYSYSSLVGDAYDSTTDGTFNYLVGFGNQAVYRTNLDYTGATQLFGGLGELFLGITYDRTNNSLWISSWSGTVVRNYSLGGTLLGSFNVPNVNNGALALDPATDTLWIADRTQQGRYREFTKSGTLLQNILIPALQSQNVLGGEFAFVAVPEPTTIALISTAGVVMAAGAWRLRRRAANRFKRR
jgi:hypothetical protein